MTQQPALGRRGTVAKHSFVERALGVLSMREDMFREIIEDASASQQALRALFIAGLGPAIGLGLRHGYIAFPLGLVFWMVVWSLFGGLTYLLATRVFASPTSVRNAAGFARGAGFAGLPMLVRAGGVAPVLEIVLTLIGLAWAISATIVMTRIALKLDTNRAAGSCLLGAFVLIVLNAFA